ncbi:hypothetical protein MKX03_031180 [Papaver bracteatum]|nr:hypothetical protein MKX03_031180 [Papaver bracteatum]
MELQTQLNPSSVVSGNVLVTNILSIFETSLSMLNQIKLDNESTTPNSSIGHFGGSLFSNCGSDVFQGGSRKRCRKGIVTWTQQVRACEQGGFQGPLEDGYGWRKYGQKKILGAAYPRSYYKCSYQSSQNCLAMKQVQRSDLNSSMFNVTYIGKHSCSETPGQYSPNKQGHIHGHSRIYQEQRADKSLEETYMNFQNPTVQIAKQKDKQLESYPSFSIYSTISLQQANISNRLETRENHFTFTSPTMDIHSPSLAYISTPTTLGSNHKMHHFGGYHCGEDQTTVDSIEELDQMIASFLDPIATSSTNNDYLIYGSPWDWNPPTDYSHSY